MARTCDAKLLHLLFQTLLTGIDLAGYALENPRQLPQLVSVPSNARQPKSRCLWIGISTGIVAIAWAQAVVITSNQNLISWQGRK